MPKSIRRCCSTGAGVDIVTVAELLGTPPENVRVYTQSSEQDLADAVDARSCPCGATT
ncbi:hypothetical protein [Nocardia terpenica]|uniref:hypothetical protein n=1 Tax=Nocardia terpenica TaxID=455432 RepID=UPI0012FD82F4|nr:hypothetical protein [Nocardia terpenica]